MRLVKFTYGAGRFNGVIVAKDVIMEGSEDECVKVMDELQSDWDNVPEYEMCYDGVSWNVRNVVRDEVVMFYVVM